MAGFLLVLAVIFFTLTIVRMGGTGMTAGASDTSAKNKQLARRLFAVVVRHGGARLYLAPLYDLFCRTTGFGGTPGVAQ